MQVPTIILAVAIEIYLVLLIGIVVLLLYLRKQKDLIRRQQEKLLQLLNKVKANTTSTPLKSEKTYKHFINEQLQITQQRFSLVAPNGNINEANSEASPLEQRVAALRYAFLRAEELSTVGEIGSDEYWNLFQQSLEPLLQVTTLAPESSSSELDTYKKRVENLEKFKQLFFDLEQQWNAAQANAQNYYLELASMAHEVVDEHRFTELLNNYHAVYGDINQSISSANTSSSGAPSELKTINIIRQDPRAAEEIIKLRNVAADQHRVISTLQRKLEGALSNEDKLSIIGELEQQLQRQIRFVQESDTCVQLLEEELAKANEKIVEQEHLIDSKHSLGEENDQIKETLHTFTLESKDLLISLDELEKENSSLKSNLEQLHSVSVDPSASEPGNSTSTQTQNDFVSLKKQYAELEEKYLDLKLKK